LTILLRLCLVVLLVIFVHRCWRFISRLRRRVGGYLRRVLRRCRLVDGFRLSRVGRRRVTSSMWLRVSRLWRLLIGSLWWLISWLWRLISRLLSWLVSVLWCRVRRSLLSRVGSLLSCRVGRLEFWCVWQSEEGSQPGVGERVLETVVLVEITILKRRVEVLKVHLEPAVTIMLGLAQVVVDGVARLESVTTGVTLEVFPMVQTITTSVTISAPVTTSISVPASVSTSISVPAISATKSTVTMTPITTKSVKASSIKAAISLKSITTIAVTAVLSVMSVTASVSVAGIAVGTIPVVIVVVIIVFGMLRMALVILFLVAIAFVMFLVFRLMFVMILVVILVVFVLIFAV